MARVAVKSLEDIGCVFVCSSDQIAFGGVPADNTLGRKARRFHPDTSSVQHI